MDFQLIESWLGEHTYHKHRWEKFREIYRFTLNHNHHRIKENTLSFRIRQIFSYLDKNITTIEYVVIFGCYHC